MRGEATLEMLPPYEADAKATDSNGASSSGGAEAPSNVLVLARPGGKLTSVARWMRSRGLPVVEVGTPLEAISFLLDEELQFASVFVAGPIAGSPSAVIAAVLAEAFPDVHVVPG